MTNKRYYQGQYQVLNKTKYKGDFDKVMYRSRWEALTFKWCDLNPDVIEWSSEEIVIPYMCRTDNRQHRYFVDLYLKFKNGKMLLVEIKPEIQIKEPKFNKKKKESTMLNEGLTYLKNISKWDAARAFAHDNGMTFQVWGETALKSIGINILK